MTREQWEIKKGYADEAARLTDVLFKSRVADVMGSKIDVINTNSWIRKEMVFLSKEQSSAGDKVIDESDSSY